MIFRVIDDFKGDKVKESLIYLHRTSGTRALPRKMTHLVAVVAFALVAAALLPGTPVSSLRTVSGKMAFLAAIVAAPSGLCSLCINQLLPEGQSLAMCPYPPQL